MDYNFERVFGDGDLLCSFHFNFALHSHYSCLSTVTVSTHLLTLLTVSHGGTFSALIDSVGSYNKHKLFIYCTSFYHRRPILVNCVYFCDSMITNIVSLTSICHCVLCDK